MAVSEQITLARENAFLHNVVTTLDRLDGIKRRVMHHVAQTRRYGYSVEYFAGLDEQLTQLEQHLDILEAEEEEQAIIRTESYQ